MQALPKFYSGNKICPILQPDPQSLGFLCISLRYSMPIQTYQYVAPSFILHKLLNAIHIVLHMAFKTEHKFLGSLSISKYRSPYSFQQQIRNLLYMLTIISLTSSIPLFANQVSLVGHINRGRHEIMKRGIGFSVKHLCTNLCQAT